MAVTFFPSNPAQSAAVQAQFGANAAVDVARIRAEEMKALAQAQMQQQAQQQQREQFWRAQQSQQQDALAREQLKSTDFFNRGRLTNDQAQIAATLEANKSRDMATAAWHQAQLAPQLQKAAALKAGEEQDAAMLGAQLGNLAKVRNEYDRLTADLSKLSAMETAQTEQAKLPAAPSTANRFFRGMNQGLVGLVADPLGAQTTTGFKPQATTADGRKIATQGLSVTRERLQQQLGQLGEIIKSNQELTALLSKAPDGSWVPALPGGVTSTNAPQAVPFFNAPAPVMTNAPAIVPVAPMTNAPAFNSVGAMPPPPPAGAIVRQNGVAYRFDGSNYIPVQ